MKQCSKALISLTLILTMLCPSVFAVKLQMQSSGSESAQLSLTELGEASVHSVQLTLEFSGSYPGIRFSSDDTDGKYGTVKTVSEGGKTKVVVYVDSPKSMNQNGTAALGTLTLGGSYTAPGSADLIMLDRSLKPSEDKEQSISVQVTSGDSSSGSSSRQPVRVSSAENGTVILSSANARPGEKVTVTVSPDNGYRLAKLTILSGGKEIALVDKGNGVYEFTMPRGAVEVKAEFVQAGTSSIPFADVSQDAWYYDAVQYVYEKGLMNGTSSTSFSPNSSLSRGMVITMLYRMAGSPATGNADFKDVPADQYYSGPVAWAAANGVVSGYGDGRFGPNNPVTREQMAVILQGYAKLNGKDVSKRADLSGFTDAGQISDYAVEAIRWANAEGLVNGTSPTTLTPRGTATRAQAATLFRNFSENIMK